MPPPPPQPQPQPPSPLPPPRALLTTLLTTFSTLPTPPTDPPTSLPSTSNTAPSPPAKPLLLTLHALYPNTLLPALDLLDRRLVTKLTYRAPAPSSSDARYATAREHGVSQAMGGEGSPGRVVYYVQSSAPQQKRDARSRYGEGGGGGGMTTSYEVRTGGWACSCKAFAFAAFSATAMTVGGGGYVGYGDWGGGGEGDGDGDEMLLDGDEEGGGESGEWTWGGWMGEGDVPLCKHLLACVLAERWTVAGGMVEEREVGREEMAGWAAGWGG